MKNNIQEELALDVAEDMDTGGSVLLFPLDRCLTTEEMKSVCEVLSTGEISKLITHLEAELYTRNEGYRK